MKQCAQWLWCRQMRSYFDFFVWLLNRENHLIMKMRGISTHILLCSLFIILQKRANMRFETRISFLLRAIMWFSKIFKFDCKRNLYLSNTNVHLWRFCAQRSQFLWFEKRTHYVFQQKIEFKNKNIHHNKKITNFCFQTSKTKIHTHFFIVRCANRQRNVRDFLII